MDFPGKEEFADESHTEKSDPAFIVPGIMSLSDGMLYCSG
jgi:hypothetical protein